MRLNAFPSIAIIPALACLAAVAIASCSPPRAAVQVSGMKVMNQNELGESAPVKLRIYPLRNDAKFRSSTADALWMGDEDLLKADLTHAPTVTSVFPGGEGRDPGKVEVELGDGAKFLGVLALYTKSDATDRRMLVLPIDDAERIVVTCSGYSITAEAPAKK